VISKSGLTGPVDRMARAGLVERTGAPDDRRVVHVTLTPAGAGRSPRGRRRAFPAHLAADEAGVIERALRRVRDENAG
jgi:DNA-binding MarR family transcriptional regulator